MSRNNKEPDKINSQSYKDPLLDSIKNVNSIDFSSSSLRRVALMHLARLR